MSLRSCFASCLVVGALSVIAHAADSTAPAVQQGTPAAGAVAGNRVTGGRTYTTRANEQAAGSGAPHIGTSTATIDQPMQAAVPIDSDKINSHNSQSSESKLNQRAGTLRYTVRMVPPLKPGDAIACTVPAPVDAHSPSITTPDGRSEAVYVQRYADQCNLRYPQVHAVGAYRLSYRSDGQPHYVFFVVAAPAVDSVPRKSAKHVQPVQSADSPEQLAQVLTAGRPRPFDGFLPAMAIAVALFAVSIYLECTSQVRTG